MYLEREWNHVKKRHGGDEMADRGMIMDVSIMIEKEVPGARN